MNLLARAPLTSGLVLCTVAVALAGCGPTVGVRGPGPGAAGDSAALAASIQRVGAAVESLERAVRDHEHLVPDTVPPQVRVDTVRLEGVRVDTVRVQAGATTVRVLPDTTWLSGVRGSDERVARALDSLVALAAAVRLDLAAARDRDDPAAGLTWWQKAGVAIQALAILVLLITWIGTLRANKYLKGQDIVLEYHGRFAELLELKQRAWSTEGAERYYGQYWFLNHQEFTFWRKGFIPNATYLFWMKARRSDWEKDPLVGPVPFRKGWEDVRDAYDGTDFACFMSGVLRDDAERPDLEALMKDFGPRWRVRSPIARGA